MANSLAGNLTTGLFFWCCNNDLEKVDVFRSFSIFNLWVTIKVFTWWHFVMRPSRLIQTHKVPCVLSFPSCTTSRKTHTPCVLSWHTRSTSYWWRLGTINSWLGFKIASNVWFLGKIILCGLPLLYSLCNPFRSDSAYIVPMYTTLMPKGTLCVWRRLL